MLHVRGWKYAKLGWQFDKSVRGKVNWNDGQKHEWKYWFIKFDADECFNEQKKNVITKHLFMNQFLKCSYGHS